MAQNPLTGQTDVTDPIARLLMQQAMQDQPMYHWLQPLGKIAQFGVGAYLDKNRREANEKELKDFYSTLPGLGPAPTTSAVPVAPGSEPTAEGPGAAPAAARPGPSPVGPSRDIAAASTPGKPSAPAIPRAGVPGATNLSSLVLEAAQKTGVDPAYLTRLTGAESGNDPTARSDQGAQGLGQFLPGTWKTYIAKYGPLYGYGPETPPSDPRANMLMTAHYTKDSMEAFERQHGRKAQPGELYAMHFLGPEGAQRLFANPTATMDRLFPELTSRTLPDGRPNPRYSPTNIAAMTQDGRFLTGQELLQRLGGKVGGPASSPAGAQMAQAPGATTAPGAPTPSTTDVTRLPGAIPPEVVAQIRRGLASTNPQVRAAAMGLYQQYATPDKPTDEARNYALYARQEQAAGRPVKSMYEWMLDIRRAGAPPTGEKSYEIETGKSAAKAVAEARESAGTSMQIVPQLSRMLQLLDAVRTGPLAGQQLTWGRIANALKIDIGSLGLSSDQVADAEELQSLAIKQLTAVAKTLGANPTNYDAKLIEQMLPSLGKSVEGNRQIIATLQRAIRFQQVYAAEIEKWADANKGNLSGFTSYFADKYADGIPMRGGTRTSPPGEAPPAPPAGAPTPAPEKAAPQQGQRDAQGRFWAEDAMGRRYYEQGGKWFNSDGTPATIQQPGQRQ